MPGFSPSGHARLEVLVTKIEVYKESYGRNEKFASIEDLRGQIACVQSVVRLDHIICARGNKKRMGGLVNLRAYAAEIPAKSSLGRNSEA
ncbi:uncharacterized protein RAG0_04961 [Rhynchosporium agropyri]|uniref:Uncharacterized protein n=1 Tax=Rhynchosporium agropyri TaxID=914238 RepID=A0A1E1KB46_9HELO|nr:uncharacterized protein RAG0_04961 [Rhynchosporium agropyri]